MMRKLLKITGYILFLFIIVFILSEIILRIWSPFQFRQGDKNVILPRNRKMIFTNKTIPGIDTKIIHTKNSLGFRGPEPPLNLNEISSIIAVGGSTTECFYLSDSVCWTNLLASELRKQNDKIWINNAGYQGHSTYGNFILVNDYIKYLKPKYILLLEGMNEVNRTDIKIDESIAADSKKTSPWGWIKRHSYVVSTVLNIQRKFMADELGVTDNNYDLTKTETLVLADSYLDSATKNQIPLVNGYVKRLNEIIDTCLANNIQPVLITQPSLFGDAKDCITGTDLSTIKINDRYNSQLLWRLIELYNDATRQIAQRKNLLLVDLAHKMPKCSKYFYDVCHFTNAGSKKVSEILTSHLAMNIK
jgi:hypothetical protein